MHHHHGGPNMDQREAPPSLYLALFVGGRLIGTRWKGLDWTLNCTWKVSISFWRQGIWALSSINETAGKRRAGWKQVAVFNVLRLPEELQNVPFCVD